MDELAQCCNLAQYVSMGSNVFVAVSAVVAAGVAVWGLKSWRAQMKGTVQHDVALSLLVATLEYRDALIRIRWPILAQTNMPDESPLMSDRMNQIHHSVGGWYDKYFDKLYAAKGELFARRAQAEALWGAQVNTFYEDIFIAEQRLLINSVSHVNSFNLARRKTGYRDEDQVDQEMLFAVLSEGKVDMFHDNLVENVKKIEEWLKPHLVTR